MRVNDIGLGYDFKPFESSKNIAFNKLQCKIISGYRKSKASDFSSEITERAFETKFITALKKFDLNLGLLYTNEKDCLTDASKIIRTTDFLAARSWNMKKINLQNNLNFIYRNETENIELNIKNGFSVSYIFSSRFGLKFEYSINYLNRSGAADDSVENKCSIKNDIKLNKKETALLTLKIALNDYNYGDNMRDYREFETNANIKVKF